MAATTETKKNNDKPKTENSQSAAAAGPPQGYTSSATDAIGFYDADLRADGNVEGIGNGFPIHFVPLHVVLADSQIEKHKPSALIFGRLIDPCAAIRDGSVEGEIASRPLLTNTKRGDVVGIWFSAGMRDLANLADSKVYMFQEDSGKWKKIKNKPSKMKTFSISNDPNRPGKKLEVREDRRNESGGIAAPPFAGKKLAGAAAAGSTVDTGDGGGNDDIPF